MQITPNMIEIIRRGILDQTGVVDGRFTKAEAAVATMAIDILMQIARDQVDDAYRDTEIIVGKETADSLAEFTHANKRVSYTEDNKKTISVGELVRQLQRYPPEYPVVATIPVGMKPTLLAEPISFVEGHTLQHSQIYERYYVIEDPECPEFEGVQPFAVVLR